MQPADALLRQATSAQPQELFGAMRPHFDAAHCNPNLGTPLAERIALLAEKNPVTKPLGCEKKEITTPPALPVRPLDRRRP